MTFCLDQVASPELARRWQERQQKVQESSASGLRNGPTQLNMTPATTVVSAALAGAPSEQMALPVNGTQKTALDTYSATQHSNATSHLPHVPRGARGQVLLPDGQLDTDETKLRCEGCNELGHDLGTCPHRSDDALAGGSESESDDDDDDEHREDADD